MQLSLFAPDRVSNAIQYNTVKTRKPTMPYYTIRYNATI